MQLILCWTPGTSLGWRICSWSCLHQDKSFWALPGPFLSIPLTFLFWLSRDVRCIYLRFGQLWLILIVIKPNHLLTFYIREALYSSLVTWIYYTFLSFTTNRKFQLRRWQLRVWHWPTAKNRPLLPIAAQVGNVKSVKLRVNEIAALPLWRDGDNVLPLHKAAQFGQKETFLYLLLSHKR